MPLLPGNTDFYTTSRAHFVGVKMPKGSDPLRRLLPAPQSLVRGKGFIEVPRGDILAPRISEVSIAHAAASGERVRWWRLESGASVPRPLPPSGGARGPGERPLVSPAGSEAFVIESGPRGVDIVSPSTLGLRHAAQTLSQVATEDGREGMARVPALRIEDGPATPIRFLGGWGLWRAHPLRAAIDLAAQAKANRVLYNAWGWIPGDRVLKEDAHLVAYARDRGIELVFELRRMSFGRDYTVANPACRGSILQTFLEAQEAGFRSFGILFDDVPWETARDECALAREVHETLSVRAGGGPPEMFCCPQHYWYPGQMNASWTGRANEEEAARQRAYLETYGQLLPPDVHVYIANYWNDHPARYQEALKAEFTDLVRRRPIFFDNQVINDYRAGAVLPFALAHRPRDFADHYAGYYLNCGRPLEAYGPTALTALSYAWGPERYDPQQAMGSALAHLLGPGTAAVAPAARGWSLLRDVVEEWSGGDSTAVNHYQTISAQLQSGARGAEDIHRWRDALCAARGAWLEALGAATGRTTEAGVAALLAMVRGTFRIDRDLELLAELARRRGAGSAPGGKASLEARFAAHRRDTIRAIADLLPPAPNLAPLLDSPGLLSPGESQAWSWVEYFLTGSTLKSLTAIEERWTAVERE